MAHQYSIAQGISAIDRATKNVLRAVDPDTTTTVHQEHIRQIKQALQEVRLDIRDYDFAQTRLEQREAARIGRHNLCVLEKHLLALDEVFGAADIAELSAGIQQIKDGLV